MILELVVTFFKVGIMTFGGGLSMLPLLERECVEKHNWATQEELLNYYAIGQCTPGIIAVNVATFIGYKEKKALGAFCATLGVVLPSFVIIVLLASILSSIWSNYYVIKAFEGIRVAVVAMITATRIRIIPKTIVDFVSFILFAVLIVLQFVFNVNPVLIVLLTVSFGSVSYYVEKRK